MPHISPAHSHLEYALERGQIPVRGRGFDAILILPAGKVGFELMGGDAVQGQGTEFLQQLGEQAVIGLPGAFTPVGVAGLEFLHERGKGSALVGVARFQVCVFAPFQQFADFPGLAHGHLQIGNLEGFFFAASWS